MPPTTFWTRWRNFSVFFSTWWNMLLPNCVCSTLPQYWPCKIIGAAFISLLTDEKAAQVHCLPNICFKVALKKYNQAIGLATLISYWLYTVFMLINALICMQSAVAPHNFWWFFKASTCALKASNSNAVKIGRLQKSLRHFEASSIILPIGIHKKTILSPKSIFLINYFISMCTIGLESNKLSHCFPIQWIVNWCIHTCTHLSKKMQTRDFNGTDIGDNQPNSLPPPFL